MFNFLKNYEMEDKDNSVRAEILERMKIIEEKLNCMLMDIKRLEEENIETSNCLYELSNSINAVDRRIDIITEHCKINYDV